MARSLPFLCSQIPDEAPPGWGQGWHAGNMWLKNNPYPPQKPEPDTKHDMDAIDK